MQLFYVPELINGSIEPDESEMRHLKVLRKKEGDSIRICDGKGRYSDATLCSIGKRAVDIAVNEIFEMPKPEPRLILCVSPLKNTERFEWMLEKCTEMGVDKIVPLMCERTESPLRKVDRLQRILRSATMQSLQYHVPELTAPVDFTEIQNWNFPAEKLIAWCEGENREPVSKAMQHGKDTVVFIGPEGDFTDREVESALNIGFQTISLGANRLRTETAGVFATAVFYMKNA